VTEPRTVTLAVDAAAALRQILGIMIDQAMTGEAWSWDLVHVTDLDTRLELLFAQEEWTTLAAGDRDVELHIEDAALLLEGMAFTEIASADLPWIDMVRWTSEFVTAELRRHWTDDDWREHQARPDPFAW